jgi:PII-like signaling protein
LAWIALNAAAAPIEVAPRLKGAAPRQSEHMTIPTDGKLLRIFIGEADHWHGKPLYEAIVIEARKRGLAGATVIKGFMGFGAHSRIHTAKLLELSQDLPIVVEIVDAPDKIEAFMPDLEQMVGDGLITLERAEVLLYRPGRQ